MAGRQISLTAMGSHSVSMVCKHLSVSAFSFASTEYPQGSSETLQTIGVCNGALLNVTSLPAGMPSQVTMQSQLQVLQYLRSLLVVVDGLLLGFSSNWTECENGMRLKERGINTPRYRNLAAASRAAPQKQHSM